MTPYQDADVGWMLGRWSSRYAAVPADDPDSAVITLTCQGMTVRTWHEGPARCSRVIGLWKDHARGQQKIGLDEGSQAVLLPVGERRRTVWTADGRCHPGTTPWLTLEGVAQIWTSPLPADAPGEAVTAAASDQPGRQLPGVGDRTGGGGRVDVRLDRDREDDRRRRPR